MDESDALWDAMQIPEVIHTAYNSKNCCKNALIVEWKIESTSELAMIVTCKLPWFEDFC